jgi:transposase-like protein
MPGRRKYTVEFKREAVALAAAPQTRQVSSYPCPAWPGSPTLGVCCSAQRRHGIGSVQFHRAKVGRIRTRIAEHIDGHIVRR